MNRAFSAVLAAVVFGPPTLPALACAEQPSPPASAAPQAGITASPPTSTNPNSDAGEAAASVPASRPALVAEPSKASPGTPAPTLPPSLALPSNGPVPTVAPLATARPVLSPGEAFVHVAVSYRDAWLETRNSIDGGDFARTCAAPCDVKLAVDGREARIVAPGMTTSNVFRFEAGTGVASLRVDGGSALARRAGIITLAAGIPVALAGMGLFAQGRVQEQKGLELAGIVGLAAGGLSVVVSLPLLLKGSTDVKNAQGSLIALGALSPAL